MTKHTGTNPRSQIHIRGIHGIARIAIAVMMLAVLFANPLEAADRIETPKGTQPSGLAYYDGHFYLSSYVEEAGIYKLIAKDGRVVERFTPQIRSVGEGRYGGLAPCPQGLVHVPANNSNCFSLFDFRTGKQIAQMRPPIPYQGISDLASDGEELWAVASTDAANPSTFKLFRLRLRNGKVLATYPMPVDSAKTQNHGLAIGNGFLWMCYDKTVLQLDRRNCQVLTVLAGPDRVSRLEGLAWDGQQLWASSFYGGIHRINTDSAKKSTTAED